MGDRLIKPDELNPKGYYEDLYFVNLNKYLLALAGGDWLNIPPEWKILKLQNSERPMQLIKNLITKRIHAKTPWGWKDPRTILTIRLFLPFLPEHYFYSSFRNPKDIAISLNKCHQIHISKGFELAKEYNRRLLKFLSEQNQTWL